MNAQKFTGVYNANWLSMGALGLAAAALVALPAFAVDVSPKTITFNTIDTSATLELTHDGQRIDAGAVKSVKLYASGHDYDHMIEVAKDDGRITVSPSDMLEIGSYDLVIDTAHGKATAYIQAPLDGLYTSLESRAKRLGITTDELKGRLGMTEKVGDEYVDLGLPSVYYVGQTVKIPIDRAEGRTYAWTVNGDPVEFGKGDSTLHYTFTEPGVYDFSYVETNGERVVATGFGATSAVAEPAVHKQYAVNTTAKFHAPEGYSHYVWEVNGEKKLAGEMLSHTFEKSGEHVVKVHAHTPSAGPAEAFREVTFVITVS